MVDPNQTLMLMREYAETILRLDKPDDARRAGLNLAEALIALNEHIEGGGALPATWEAARFPPAPDRYKVTIEMGGNVPPRVGVEEMGTAAKDEPKEAGPLKVEPRHLAHQTRCKVEAEKEGALVRCQLKSGHVGNHAVKKHGLWERIGEVEQREIPQCDVFAPDAPPNPSPETYQCLKMPLHNGAHVDSRRKKW